MTSELERNKETVVAFYDQEKTMPAPNGQRLARILGVIVLVLAWTAAAIQYNTTGQVRWSLVFAGIFFAVLPFASSGTKRS